MWSELDVDVFDEDGEPVSEPVDENASGEASSNQVSRDVAARGEMTIKSEDDVEDLEGLKTTHQDRRTYLKNSGRRSKQS